MLIKLQFIVPKSSINADAITPLGKRILSEISQSNTGPVIKKKKKMRRLRLKSEIPEQYQTRSCAFRVVWP